MAKIIKFPTPEERQEKKEMEELQEATDSVTFYSDNCAQSTQNMVDIIEDAILSGTMHEWDVFMGMRLREMEIYPESRDFFVLMNLFNAMLARFVGLPHHLHRDLDGLLIKIKAMEKYAQNQQELEDPHQPELEITFEPDFELDPEDDNN